MRKLALRKQLCLGIGKSSLKKPTGDYQTPSGRYINHIYGLEEVGGTSVLLISDVAFGELGYPTEIEKEPLPLLTWHVLQKIPNFVLLGNVLLGGIWWITARREKVAKSSGSE